MTRGERGRRQQNTNHRPAGDDPTAASAEARWAAVGTAAFAAMAVVAATGGADAPLVVLPTAVTGAAAVVWAVTAARRFRTAARPSQDAGRSDAAPRRGLRRERQPAE